MVKFYKFWNTAMLHRLLRLASGHYFVQGMQWLIVPLYMLAALLLWTGLANGLWHAPTDAVQGEVYRIMYLHVPFAAMSLGLYTLVGLMGVVSWVTHIKLADVIMQHAASVGWMVTTLTLLTGALWGKPTWGTYWIWDARLTSELLLWFLYAGQFVLRTVLSHRPSFAARACALLAMLGLLDLPIIHYSVQWWFTLHQGPTLLAWQAPKMAAGMLWPLLQSGLGFAFLAAALIIRATCDTIHRKNGGFNSMVEVGFYVDCAYGISLFSWCMMVVHYERHHVGQLFRRLAARMMGRSVQA